MKKLILLTLLFSMAIHFLFADPLELCGNVIFPCTEDPQLGLFTENRRLVTNCCDSITILQEPNFGTISFCEVMPGNVRATDSLGNYLHNWYNYIPFNYCEGQDSFMVEECCGGVCNTVTYILHITFVCAEDLSVCEGDPNGDLAATGLTATCADLPATIDTFDFEETAFPITVLNAGDGGSATTSVALPLDLTITNIAVDIDMWHSKMSDVKIDITSPEGTTISIMNGINGWFHDLGPTIQGFADGTGVNGSGTYTFTDGAVYILGIVGQGANYIEGTYQPVESLSALTPEDPNGIWTIDFEDDSNGEDGEFTGASIIITSTPSNPDTISWWNAPTGGTQVGSGSPFDPTGLAGEEQTTVDVDVPGTYTFYAQCGCPDSTTTRVAVECTIIPTPTIIDPNLDFCDTIGLSSYDLSQHDAVVGGGDSVLWFDGNPASGATLISPATSVDLIAVDSLFAQVTDLANCTVSMFIPVCYPTANIIPIYPGGISSGMYYARDFIYSEGSVLVDSIVDFNAGTIICIGNGSAIEGDFSAEIKDCEDPPESRRE